MKTIRLTLISLLLCIIGQSLGAQSIVGTWETTATNGDGDITVTVLTFNEDGTFVREQQQTIVIRKDQPSRVNSHEEGKWELMGKRVVMKVKPSSVTAETPDGENGGLAKLVKISKKADAVGSMTFSKILSLTEDELVLRESYDEEIAGETTTYTEKVTYKRK